MRLRRTSSPATCTSCICTTTSTYVLVLARLAVSVVLPQYGGIFGQSWMNGTPVWKRRSWIFFCFPTEGVHNPYFSVLYTMALLLWMLHLIRIGYNPTNDGTRIKILRDDFLFPSGSRQSIDNHSQFLDPERPNLLSLVSLILRLLLRVVQSFFSY